MTIELNEDSYIVGVWFSSSPDHNNDWMGCVIKHPDEPDCYKGSYRFRYSKDSKIFDSEDEKSWTDFTTTQQSEDNVIEVMEIAQKQLESGYPDSDKIIVKGGLEKLMELAKDKPWFNMRREKV